MGMYNYLDTSIHNYWNEFLGIKSVFQQSNTRMKLACTIGVKRIAYPIPRIAQKIDVPARKYSWAFLLTDI